MWSPVHPALFACVDGMGRLDLWNLNNDTEVSCCNAGAWIGRVFWGGAQPTSLCHPLSPKRTFGALTIQLPTKTRSFILDWCEVKLADAPAKNHFISETQAEPGPFSLQRAKRYEFTGACSYGEGHTGIFQSGVEITLFANTWKSKLFVDAGFR